MLVPMQKIIIDTDPGQDIDDLLAIHFALLRPELDILAITTVTWPTDKRARLIKRLLRYLNRPDIPVAAGEPYPLRPFSDEDRRNQHNLACTMNHYAFAEPEDPQDTPGSEGAVDLIIRTVEQYPGEVILCCIAPLTNIACALRRNPGIARKIKAIALMGGETALNRVEHNSAFDYVATDIVLSSGIPIAMGTWDITRRFVLSMQDCERFTRSVHPLHQALARAIALWHPVQNWKPGPVMYDLFPLVWAFAPALYTLAPLSIRIETEGRWTRGMTIPRGDGVPIHVTTGIHEPELRELYFRTIMPA